MNAVDNANTQTLPQKMANVVIKVDKDFKVAIDVAIAQRQITLASAVRAALVSYLELDPAFLKGADAETA